jgi:hypothetical protein
MDLGEVKGGNVHWIVQVESNCECDDELSGVHKMLGSCRVAIQLVALRVALNSI